uniref:Vomeronasal type-1 receptor n=1 Tax=Nannospalax galili TaxID=1026970 RepID=A0A4Y1N604_NANGA|nr:vomeronasal type 1 receptor 16 [Nannospalax galili]AWV50036.1 vomeronasal type 1 receptor 16 [Nannospalax galili]AWV50038.1 vomeronasal type 1 receptor 16 [Nannospalax galili]AWV50044.1 vomeronasal type 1 receptor 16 [Nannospalax galili]AWV50047.1 vomeronasal type 1 receptor 16 [Nannospalax galili]
MVAANVAMGIVFFSQTLVGILGNCSLLLHYFMSVFTEKSLMPKDQILKHVTFANFLSVISRGIPQTMAEFGLKYFLDDFVCKLIIYSNRVSRGISLYTMCVLSCFQAITISSSSPKWMKLKHRMTKYINPSCSVSWLVHLFLNSKVTMRVTSLGNNRNFTKKFNFGHCSGFGLDNIAGKFYLFLICFTDFLYLSLMAWASISMLSILYRHKKQMQYIHSAQHCPRVSPEARATQAVLILLCIFVFFNSMSFLQLLYITLCDNPKLWLISILSFLDTCFPTSCPFLFISSNGYISRIYLPSCRNK